MYDLINRKALLEAYDNAHNQPPGNARRLIEEAPRVISGYEDVDTDFPSAVSALLRAQKKKVDDCEYGLPVYDENGCQIECVFMYRAKCPECGYVILDGDFEKFDVGDYEINFCQRCGQALDWSDVK